MKINIDIEYQGLLIQTCQADISRARCEPANVTIDVTESVKDTILPIVRKAIAAIKNPEGIPPDETDH